MTTEEIQAKQRDLQERISALKKELEALRNECPHEHRDSTGDYSLKGEHEFCLDCGKDWL